MVGVADPAGASFDSDWLPVGFHWGLHIRRWPHALEGGGGMNGGGDHGTQHITVSRWPQVTAMASVLVNKNAMSHVLIGGEPGLKDPVVYQFLPFSQAARALEHPAGTPPTNGAGRRNPQMEVCAMPGRSMTAAIEHTDPREWFCTLFDLPDVTPAHAHLLSRDHDELEALAGDGGQVGELEEELAAASKAFMDGVASWTDETYKAIGNLWALIAHRTGVPPELAAHFSSTARLSPQHYNDCDGYLGHMHVPNQPSGHSDPTTAFNGGKLIQRIKTAPNKL